MYKYTHTHTHTHTPNIPSWNTWCTELGMTNVVLTTVALSIMDATFLTSLSDTFFVIGSSKERTGREREREREREEKIDRKRKKKREIKSSNNVVHVASHQQLKENIKHYTYY